MTDIKPLSAGEATKELLKRFSLDPVEFYLYTDFQTNKLKIRIDVGNKWLREVLESEENYKEGNETLYEKYFVDIPMAISKLLIEKFPDIKCKYYMICRIRFAVPYVRRWNFEICDYDLPFGEEDGE